MQECRYKYLVLEMKREGIHIIASQLSWFEWVGEDSLSDKEGKWVELKECDKWPKFAFSACNFNEIG